VWTNDPHHFYFVVRIPRVSASGIREGFLTMWASVAQSWPWRPSRERNVSASKGARH
jgi:hypothetical protein